jgi:hypothetical protein
VIAVETATYEPTAPHLIVVKSRLSHSSWIARIEKARREASVMEKIVAHVGNGDRRDATIRKVVPASRRSWVLRHWDDFKKLGWEALIDERLPREPKIAKACGKLIESAREANPEISVSAVLEILRAQKVAPLPSPSTTRTHLKRADRRMGRRKREKRAAEQIIETSCAGGELLLAAEMETGAISALTTVVESLANEAKAASKGLVPECDTGHRDEMGRFTAEYNERRMRKPGEEIASYLRSAEEKAVGRVPSWPRFVHERRDTLDAKLKALTFAPLVSATQGWDALRSPQAADLGALAGFPYMPSTLYKFTSALAISSAGSRMLEAVGTHWHGVATKRWAEEGAMAALYVDNHAKEIWTSLFTMSGKVSSLNRVMPCITTTYVHTGAGAPLVASVQSGSAPLAPRLLELVERAEELLGDDIARATIIDAEGSVFDVLEAFAKAGRVIVTPLRPSRAPELELTYTPGSYFRPYREHDELRIAQAQLHHRTTGRSLELGALLIRRGDRESETVLLTTGTQQGFNGRDLADLYFLRWPLQENAFKDGEVVGLDCHRGNSSRMVANVAMVTELEKLRTHRESTAKELCERQQSESAEAEAVAVAERAHRAAQSRLGTRRERMDALLESGKVHGKAFSKVAVEHHEALQQAEKTSNVVEQAQSKLTATQHKIKTCESTLDKQNDREKKLEPRQKIRQLDTALDSILTSTKLTCLLLISFVLREYLSTISMSPQTFVSRVFSIRGRRELRPGDDAVIFYENPRDPELTRALEEACTHLNAKKLVRDGRRVRYCVEDPPKS